VERLTFRTEDGFVPRSDFLDNVTVAPLTAPIAGGTPVQAAVFRIAPNGRIVRHPATVPQILAVLEGAGYVSGGDGQFEPISTGEAVFWSAGEEHETTTQTGLTALILEGEGLRPFGGFQGAS
jgi:quercetin dioxygenase-like cupin family protein